MEICLVLDAWEALNMAQIEKLDKLHYIEHSSSRKNN
jgi:hypothetical protein